jgi:hypothetical protein
MLGAEIVAFFKKQRNLKRHFRGTLAADRLQTISLKNKQFAIVNTDVLAGDGLHWYLIFRICDRYGTNPRSFDHRGFLLIVVFFPQKFSIRWAVRKWSSDRALDCLLCNLLLLQLPVAAAAQRKREDITSTRVQSSLRKVNFAASSVVSLPTSVCTTPTRSFPKYVLIVFYRGYPPPQL